MSDIQKQLALALQQLQKASEAQYDDLQRQLNELNEQLISVTQDLSPNSGAAVTAGGSMTKATDRRSVCESCKNGMFYKHKADQERPMFECLVGSDIRSPVFSCNQFDQVVV